MRTRVFCLLLLVTGGIMVAQSTATKGLSITVSAPPSPSPTGNLLTGMTPTKFTLPAGWSVWQMEDFDTTTPICAQTNEFCGYGNTTTAQAHSGTHSSVNTYNNRWSTNLPAGKGEVYLSYWGRYDSNGAQNDEMYVAEFRDANFAQEDTLDWFQTVSLGFNQPNSNLVFARQVDYNPGYPPTEWAGNVGFDGQWHQWEIHFKQSTPSSGGTADGIIQVWKDGVLLVNHVGVINNTNVNMANGMFVMAGGTYTKLVWLKNCSDQSGCSALLQAGGPFTCGAAIGDGYGSQPAPYDPSNEPCAPAVPGFNHYIDDVIVLYK